MPFDTEPGSNVALPTGLPAGSARRVASASLLLSMESLLRLGTIALVSFWIATRIGPAAYGLLNLASAVLAVLLVASSLGLELPVVTRLASGEPRGPLLRTLLRLRLRAALLALVLALAAALLLRPGDAAAQAVIMIAALAVLAYVPQGLELAFKAEVQPLPAALARLGATLLSALAKVAVVLAGGSLAALAWTLVFEAVAASLLLAWAYRRHFGAAGAKPAGTPVAPAALLRHGLPMLAAAAATVLLLKADVLLLGFFASDADVGHYVLAQKLCEVLTVVPLLLLDSLYPLLARTRAAGGVTSDQLMFDLAAATAWLVVSLNWLAAPALVAWFFGPGYAASAPLAQWLGLAVLFMVLDAARARWLVGRGEQARAWIYPLAGLVLAVAGHLWAIPQHGTQGAAAVSVLAWLAVALLAPLLDPRGAELARLQWRALWPWGRLAGAWRAA